MSNTPNPNEDLSPDVVAAGIPTGTGTTDVYSGTGLPANFIPPPQLKVKMPSGSHGQLIEKTQVAQTSAGTYGIVNASNQVQDFYQPSKEAGVVLSGLNDVNRNFVLGILYRKGWYGSSKPGNGFGDSDRNAMADLLYYSNTQGLTWDQTLKLISQAPDFVARGGTASARPSSADLKEILNQTALKTVGKYLPEEEINKMVSAYQGVYQGATTENAPTADTFFKNRIEQQYGADTDAYKYLNAISSVSKVLGSL
jgi:hypothetical protein